MFDFLVSPHFVLFARLCVGGVFLVSAITKMMDRQGTAVSMGRYPFLPSGAGKLIAYVFPFVELAVSVMLILGLFTQLASVVAAGLFVLFTILIIYDLTRGQDQSCHCFGRVSAERLTPLAVVRNVALLAMSALVLLAFDGWLAADLPLSQATNGGLGLLAQSRAALPGPADAIPVALLALFTVAVIVVGEQAFSTVRSTIRGLGPRQY